MERSVTYTLYKLLEIKIIITAISFEYMQESALNNSHTIVIFLLLPAIMEGRYHSHVIEDRPEIQFLS